MKWQSPSKCKSSDVVNVAPSVDSTTNPCTTVLDFALHMAEFRALNMGRTDDTADAFGRGVTARGDGHCVHREACCTCTFRPSQRPYPLMSTSRCVASKGHCPNADPKTNMLRASETHVAVEMQARTLFDGMVGVFRITMQKRGPNNECAFCLCVLFVRKKRNPHQNVCPASRARTTPPKTSPVW